MAPATTLTNGKGEHVFNENETLMKAPLLHQNLMLQRRDRDPMIYYEVVSILGKGSMGSVSKVKKREESGSARPGFLQSYAVVRSNNNLLTRISRCCWNLCFDDEEEECFSSQSHPRDLFVPVNPMGIPHRSPSSLQSPTSECLPLIPKEELSSMIRFERQDAFFALKSIHYSMAKNQTLIEELKNEVEILKTLDHPNIVRPVETFEYRNSLYLVMELCSGGDLYSRDPYCEADAARIALSILKAVAYMHSQGIAHRDLKFENVMFVSTHPLADVKIIDFGLSKMYGATGQEVMDDSVGTVYSMSPEVLQGKYTKQADLWACGVLTFMLLSSSMPFYGPVRDIVVKRIARGKFEFRSHRWFAVSDDAKSFVTSLLQMNPEDRPSAEVAARNAWLNHASKSGGRHHKCTSSNLPESMDTVQASIENFANHSPLKKLALMVIAYRSTNEEIGFIRRMFKKYDDNQGYFTLHGFKNALRDYVYSDDELERIFKGMDIDGSGAVHYFEFLAASMEAHGFINEQQLADAFDRLDADDSGTISVNDLRKFLGNELSTASIGKIIEEDDMDADRQVSYQEFLQMWDIESDSLREKTLNTVAGRRRNQIHPPQHREPNAFTQAITEGFSKSDSSSSTREFEAEVGDVTFGVQKDISIRRASPMKPHNKKRPKSMCADV